MIDFSVRRLSDKAVELGFVETISLDTIQRLLKKNETVALATGSLVPAQSGRGVCGSDGGGVRRL